MAQQTAVEWLVDQIKSDQNQKALSASEWMEVIEKAKQMEMEQIIEAFDCDGTPQPGEVWISNGEQYYSETYNK